jgi:hypothetical protein
VSIINYGKKLVNDGHLKYVPELQVENDFFKLWTPDFMESIVFIKSTKSKYQSVLHFFWVSIFHMREVNGVLDAEEIFSSTHLYKISFDEAVDKIKSINPDWFKKNDLLIPKAKWYHLIWNDENDVFITFEDEDQYYGWGWDSTL